MTAPALTAGQRKLLDWLTEVAAIGEPCPSNLAIKARCGFASDTTAIDAVAKLEKLGLVAVDRGPTWRVVTIVATGQSTARPRTAPPLRARPEPSVRHRDEPSADPADRLAAIAASVARKAPAAPPPEAPPPPKPPRDPEAAAPAEPDPAPEPPAMPASPPAAAPDAPAADGLRLHLALDGSALIVRLFARDFLTVPLDDRALLDLAADAAIALRRRHAA